MKIFRTFQQLQQAALPLQAHGHLQGTCRVRARSLLPTSSIPRPPLQSFCQIRSLVRDHP